MENSGRPYRGKRGGRERGAAAAEKGESWWMQDQLQGQNIRSDGGQQAKKNQSGPYRASPKKGGLGPLSRSPGGLRGGHSPSQRDDLRWFTGPQEDNWRERSQQHRRRGTQEGPKEDREQGRRESTDDSSHKSGKRRRNRNKKKSFAEENRGLVIEESVLSNKELRSIRQAEKRLNRVEVYSLKKKSHSNPAALYSCALCDVFLDSLSEAYRHIRDKRHRRRAKERQEQVMLTEILPPSPEQISAISAVLDAVVQKHGLTDQDVERRRCVVSTMQDLLLSVLPEIRLRLYGSSCTKFGFKDSDMNIDIQYPTHMHQPDVLLLVKECLSVSPLFIDMEADFHARVPVVICKEKKSGLICKVSAGNENAFQTTSYLSALGTQEPLLVPLVLGFRRWARICEIDRAEEGGLPPYVFALLVIYFLQKRKESLLPTYFNQDIKVFSLSRLSDFNLTHVEDGCLHWAYTPSSKESQPAEGTCRKGKVPLVLQSPRPPVEVGLLWVEMLRFYSLEFNMAESVISVRTSVVLSREMKDWPKKRIAIEDPFAVKRNVARTVNSQQMFEYILHCLKTTYKYFAQSLNTQAANHKRGPKGGRIQGANAKPSNEESACLSDFSQLSVHCTSQPKPIENGPEDSDCIIEEEEEIEEFSDSDEEREKEKVDLGKSSVSEDEDDEEEEQDEDVNIDVDSHNRQHLDSFNTEDEEIFLVDEISGEEHLSDEEGPDLDTPGSMDEEEEEEVDSAPIEVSLLPSEDQIKDESPESKNQKQSRLSYEFTKQAFTRGKSHMVVCSLCKRDGHLKKDCPEDFKKVQLEPLPPLTPEFLSVLNKVCEQCYSDFAPDELEVGVREHILQDLELFVRRQFDGARLQLFGSSKNGFGFRQSDLDICMVLEGQETIDDIDCINIIESLARLLKKHPDLRNILPITTAKVPIVKFYHVRTGLEGDISLYNTLALHNTHLLATYAAIDRRVKILCYAMKVFAKMCDIGDASRGSLSSYAYTLMVLFFLQQRNPPVIPVLQEIYDGKKPEVLVDGWNVYFFDDLKALPSHWPHYGKNTETVGELWLNLLRFYTEDFDFREHVVCVRQLARLTTFNKQWTSKYIVIEDPFDLNHNLGAGLSRKMTNFIMKALINGRRVFGTPVRHFPPVYPSQMEYFFDPEVLTEGEVAPNDRCCRICGKIGHFMKDCPMRKKPKHRRDSERRSEQPQDKVNAAEESKDQVRHKSEHWRKRDGVDIRCCYLCGSNAHIKKDCQLYRSPAGNVKLDNFSSSPHLRNLRETEKQGIPIQEDKKKRKQQNVILSPQAGSLACRNLGRSGQRKSPVE
ncbi:terminal uridylyltransferase 7 [Archocentrus centrarchus]|uniref:terminal uridylyltransferase 7 n=1 Tax=Archocentrus centrarchus TaxID=63155 RepID=UPI0011EA437E|nr:terminal uridylyltransferase 7 [Archocentrus centrarchus]XP_030593882.1 terminal uridylyltransferase 7 [Archocentrus centrarchus]